MEDSKYQLFPSTPNPGDGFHYTNAFSATPSTSSSTPSTSSPTDSMKKLSEEKLSEEEIKRKNRAEKKRKNDEEKGKLYAFVFVIKDTHVLFKKNTYFMSIKKYSNNNMKTS